jgi:two-component sensor histidine kinase
VDEAVGNPTVSLAYVPPTSVQRRLALVVTVLQVVACVVVAPISAQVPRIDSFVPVILAIIFVADLITAVLLFSQSAVIASRAVLILANGYLFSALIVVPHALTFPGAFAPKGLLGAGFQSSGWLNVFWHLGFLAAVAGYACLKGGKHRSDAVPTSALPAVFWSVAIQITLVCALTWAVTAGDRFMPRLFFDDLSYAPLVHYVAGMIVLISVLVLLLMWVRRTSTLDLWIIVAICMVISEMALVTFGITARFYLGWYVSRALAVAVSTVVLIALLTEAMRLQARLANAFAELRQAAERQKLLAAELDHRVKNVLAQVEAVAVSTSQGSRSIDAFLRSLKGRIQSMGAAHKLLSTSSWQSVGLDAVVRSQLAPYATDTNVTISGPGGVMLAAAEIRALARVLHELVTNAAKHGALSIPGGQISVRWDRKADGGGINLVLVWQELNGPPVKAEVQSSYGTSLIRNFIPHELGGKVDLVFDPEGVSCRIELPIKQASESENFSHSA